MGAQSRIGDASLVVAVLAAIPGLMMFDWIYWWAGQALGQARDRPVRRQPPEGRRADRAARADHPPLRLAGDRDRLLPAGPERADLRRRRLDADAPAHVPAARPDRVAALDRAVRRARLRDRPERGRRRQGGRALRAVRDDRADRRASSRASTSSRPQRARAASRSARTAAASAARSPSCERLLGGARGGGRVHAPERAERAGERVRLDRGALSRSPSSNGPAAAASSASTRASRRGRASSQSAAIVALQVRRFVHLAAW